MFGGMDPAARRDARLDYRGQIMDWRGQMPTPFGFGQQGIAVGEQYPGAMPINPAA
jgi:hypothetical protein